MQILYLSDNLHTEFVVMSCAHTVFYSHVIAVVFLMFRVHRQSEQPHLHSSLLVTGNHTQTKKTIITPPPLVISVQEILTEAL